MNNCKVLITGAAGFIGFHLSKRLCSEGYSVVGLDNMNSYYDLSLKESRLSILNSNEGFKFYKADICNKSEVDEIFSAEGINVVVNLAAQAGVRYSIENPQAYIDANINGFLNILEAARWNKIDHLVYASSSSVYGANKTTPFSTRDNVDHPMSLYAATKKSNELMAHTYSSLYNIPTTGLRFFTVYGPYGRPDMALFLFTKAILEDKPIKVFNNGEMMRDFTYVDDIVEGIARLVQNPAESNSEWDGQNPDSSSSYAPYKLYNIGNNNPIKLGYFIEVIERFIGKEAKKEYLPLQPGDVPETYADVSNLIDNVGYKPNTSIEKGIEEFVKWYKSYYKIDN